MLRIMSVIILVDLNDTDRVMILEIRMLGIEILQTCRWDFLG